MFGPCYGQILEYFYDADRRDVVLWSGLALLAEDGAGRFRQGQRAVNVRDPAWEGGSFRLNRMDSKEQYDFWYALNNSELLIQPEQQLESFGTTVVHYFLVTELMDAVDQVRVREGRIHAYRPQIVAPSSVMESLLEGFEGAQAESYIEWLRAHEQELMILKYGFKIRKEAIRTDVVNDRLDLVIDKLKGEIDERGRGMQALIKGVEDPWEVCLLKLMVGMVQKSIGLNVNELGRDPNGHHREISQAFEAAAGDPSKIQALADLLRRRNLFQEYEDRFFSLVRPR